MFDSRDDASSHLGRRSFLTTLGLSGLGTALWSAVGGPRQARADSSLDLGSEDFGGRPSTAILELDDSSVMLTSGPFQSFALPAGSRFGVGLLFAGAAQGRGRLPLIRGVERAEIDLPGLGTLETDRGLAQGVYRMLGGLHVERPVEIYGLSAEVGGRGVEAAGPVELRWEAKLASPAVTTERLGQYLGGFHACVLGLVAEDSRFTQMSYVEVRAFS